MGEHIEGCEGYDWADCWNCSGEGEYSVVEDDMEITYRCDTCDGKGRLVCPECLNADYATSSGGSEAK
jgi:DnaJ-class molecular chaperone